MLKLESGSLQQGSFLRRTGCSCRRCRRARPVHTVPPPPAGLTDGSRRCRPPARVGLHQRSCRRSDRRGGTRWPRSSRRSCSRRCGSRPGRGRRTRWQMPGAAGRRTPCRGRAEVRVGVRRLAALLAVAAARAAGAVHAVAEAAAAGAHRGTQVPAVAAAAAARAGLFRSRAGPPRRTPRTGPRADLAVAAIFSRQEGTPRSSSSRRVAGVVWRSTSGRAAAVGALLASSGRKEAHAARGHVVAAGAAEHPAWSITRSAFCAEIVGAARDRSAGAFDRPRRHREVADHDEVRRGREIGGGGDRGSVCTMSFGGPGCPVGRRGDIVRGPGDVTEAGDIGLGLGDIDRRAEEIGAAESTVPRRRRRR